MKKYKAVLFDLDGTLLPMDNDEFSKAYFTELAGAMVKYGYEPQKLVESIWKCVKQMVLNDGAKTNEKVFWEKLCEIYNCSEEIERPKFDAFYKKEFDNTKRVCAFSDYSGKIIKTLKAKNIKVVIATNPMFPKIAIEKRIKWAGIEPNDVVYITTYENSHYCKPNPKYYTEIVNNLALEPGQCLMVGNDVEEDMVAKTAGLDVFLLTDYIINRKNNDISGFSQGNLEKLYEIIEKM